MTKVFKQTIKVAFSTIMLIVVFIGFLFANRSLAWFAQNKDVSANGLSASVQVSPNLIIGTSAESVTRGDLTFAVDFNGMAREKMIAVTRDETIPTTYLKYLANHHAVDNQTGNALPGMELEFEPVPTTDNAPYFIDYVVYIASAFDTLSVDSLTATIDMPISVDAEHPYFNAASIDFYVEEVSLTGYRGTTSVAECLAGGAGVNLFPTGGEVPLNTKGYITVIMRCYFDGALQAPDGKAYVNSYTVKSDDVVIGVEFIAVEAQPEEA